MSGGRLGRGQSLREIIKFLCENHPKGLKRSDIQGLLLEKFNVGESVGGVNRQLKRLRSENLVRWCQESYTYVLPSDFDSADFFVRTCVFLNFSTDDCFFFFMVLKDLVSEKTSLDIEGYIGGRYDAEMTDNVQALEKSYKGFDGELFESVNKLTGHHNDYVRLRLFKTANTCFVNDLLNIDEPCVKSLLKRYEMNISAIDFRLQTESEEIFRVRGELLSSLNDKRMPSKVKFLLRHILNQVRPSQVFDGRI